MINSVARQALEKLLRSAESASAKESSARAITLRFSQKTFPAYVSIETRAEKDSCHGDLSVAEREGAIRITWERQAGTKNQVERIALLDRDLLAQFLSVIPRWDAVASAEQSLNSCMGRHPVLRSVVDLWRRGVKARGTGPSDFEDWLQAISVVEYCRESDTLDVPVRRLSAQMTADSKRIEGLWSVIDVIVQGDVSAPMRDAEDVFNEIGLVKYPPTLLIAGNLAVELANQNDHVNVAFPYLGFPPSAIVGFTVDSRVNALLTVENLTTFHEIASRLHRSPEIVLLYTGGMPSPSWKRVYRLLVSALGGSARVFHWGDIDAGGFRIADHLAVCSEQSGHVLELYAMTLIDTDKYIEVVRRELTHVEVAQIVRICAHRGWGEQAEWVTRHCVAIEQESIPITWPLTLVAI